MDTEPQLETLKDHYEQQLAQLQKQLDEDEEGEDDDDDDDGGDDEEDEEDQVNHKGVHEESVFHEALIKAKSELKDAHFMQCLKSLEEAHALTLQGIAQAHHEDLQLQLTALKVSLNEVHSSQLTLVSKEMSQQQHEQNGADHHDIQAQIKLEHNKEMTRMQLDFEQQILDSEENYEEAMANMKRRYEEEILQLKEALANAPSEADPSEVDKDCARQLVPPETQKLRDSTGADSMDDINSESDCSHAYSTSLIAELQQEIESYRSQIETYKQDTDEKHLMEMEGVKEKLQHDYEWRIKDLDNENTLLKDQLKGTQIELQTLKNQLSAKDEKIEIVKREFAEKHHEQTQRMLAELSKEHEEEVMRLQSVGVCRDLEEKHQRELVEQCRDLEAKHFEAMENMKNDLDRKHDLHVAQLRAGMDEAGQDKQDTIEQRIEAEVSRHAQEHEALMERELEALKDRVTAEMQRDFELRMMREKQDWEERKEEEIDELMQDHEDQMNAMREKQAKVHKEQELHHNGNTNDIVSLQKVRDKAAKEKHALEHELRGVRNRLEKAERELKRVAPPRKENGSTERGDTEARLKDAMAKIRQLEAKLEERESQIEDFENRMEEIENSLREKEQEVKECEEKIDDYDDKLESARSQMALYEAAVGDNENEIDELQTELSECKDKLQTSENSVMLKEEEVASIALKHKKVVARLTHQLMEAEEASQSSSDEYQRTISELQSRLTGTSSEVEPKVSAPSPEESMDGDMMQRMQQLQRDHDLQVKGLQAQVDQLSGQSDHKPTTKGDSSITDISLDELDQVQLTLKDELLGDHMRKFEQVTAALEVSHQSKVDDLKSKYEETIESLRKQVEEQRGRGEEESKVDLAAYEELLTIREELEKKLSENEEEWKGRLEEKEAEVEKLRQSEMELGEELKSDGEEIAKLRSEIQKLKESLEKEDEEKSENSVDEIEQLKEKYDAERTEMKQTIDQCNARIRYLEEELGNEDEVDELKEEIMKKIEEIELWKAENSRLQTEKDAEIATLKSDDRLSDLEEKLAEKEEEIKKWKEEVNEKEEKMKQMVSMEQYEYREIEYQALQEQLQMRSGEIIEMQSKQEAVLERALEDLRTSLEAEHREQMEEVKERLQMEISALRHSLEVLSGEGEDEKHREHADTEERMREQLHTEISLRDDQIEQLGRELMLRNDEAQQLKQHIMQLEDQLEDQREQLPAVQSPPPASGHSEESLLAMLRSDLERVSGERDATEQTNEQMLRLLSDSVRCTVLSADRIQQCLVTLTQSRSPSPHEHRRSPHRLSPSVQGAAAVDLDDPEGAHNTSVVSAYSDEGLDISQHFAESLFAGPDLDGDTEEVIADSDSEARLKYILRRLIVAADAGNRLQSSVERLLDMITETSQQLHETQKRNEGMALQASSDEEELRSLRQRFEEMDDRLRQEVEAKEYLAVELSKAEGLMQGYAKEKSEQDRIVSALEDRRLALAEELERANLRLAHYEESQAEIEAREDDLRRQRQSLVESVDQPEQVTSNVGPPEQEMPPVLLEDNSKLSEEKRELQRQHSVQSEVQMSAIGQLQSAVDSLKIQNEALVDERKATMDDHVRHIDALEKQIASTKQFIEEQTAEREQEREDFQSELKQLKESLRERDKQGSNNQRLVSEVQDLEDQLREKVEAYNEVVNKKAELERAMQTHEVALRELRDLLKQTEAELEQKDQTEEELTQRAEALENELSKLTEVNLELSEELRRREEYGSVEGLQPLVRDLEAQVATLRDAERRALDKVKVMEEQMKNLKNLEEELMQDKESLQRQVCDQLNEISSLKAQVNDLRFASNADGKLTNDVRKSREEELRDQLVDARDTLSDRQVEADQLRDQLEHVREELLDREAEIQHLTEQLEVAAAQSAHTLTQFESDKTPLQAEMQNAASAAGMEGAIPIITQSIVRDENGDEVEQIEAQMVSFTAEMVTTPVMQMEQAALIEEIGDDDDSEEYGYEEEAEEEVEEEVEECHLLKDILKSLGEEQVAEEDLEGRVLESLRLRSEEITELKRNLVEKERLLEALRNDAQQKDFDLVKSQEDKHTKLTEELNAMAEVVQEKESLIEQLSTQVQTLQTEVDDLHAYQSRLQEDYEELQGMAEARQQEMEVLSNQMQESLRPEADAICREMETKYRAEIEGLEKQVQERQNIIDEKEEDIYALNERLRDQDQLAANVENAQSAFAIQAQELSACREEIKQLQQAQLAAGDGASKAELEEALRRTLEEQETLRVEHRHDMAQLHALHERQLQEADERLQQLRKEHTEEVKRLVDQNTDLDSSVMRLPVSLCNHVDEFCKMHSEDSEQDDCSRRLQLLLEKIIDQGAHVLSLSDLQFLQSLHEGSDTTSHATSHSELYSQMAAIEEMKKAWQEEKASLVAAMTSLKDLLAATHKTTDSSKHVKLLADFMTDPGIWVLSEYGANPDVAQLDDSDWRSELLHAVHAVFAQEQESLLRDLRAQNKAGSMDAERRHTVESLALRLRDLEQHQHEGMQHLLAADRKSLLAEVNELRRQATEPPKTSEAHEPLASMMDRWKDESSKRERHLKRQIELKDYKLTQEKVLSDDLRSSLDQERRAAQELSAQLLMQRTSNCELQGEVGATQKQLSRLKDALDQEQKRLVAASSELEEERRRCQKLNENLICEQRLRSDQVQEQKVHIQRSQAAMQKQAIELETEKERHRVTSLALEQEKNETARLRKDLDDLQEAHLTTEHSCQRSMNELRSSVESEKRHIADLRRQLEAERGMNGQLKVALESARLNHQETAAIAQLQSMSDDSEREKIIQLQLSLDEERLQASKLARQLDSERKDSTEALAQERMKNRRARDNIEKLENQNKELSKELEFAGDQVSSIQADRDHLQDMLAQRQTSKAFDDDEGTAVMAKQLDTLRQRLHLLAIRHQEELARWSSRRQSEGASPSGSDTHSMASALNDILTDLQHLQQPSDAKANNLDQRVSGLNTETMRHNLELTALLSKLTDELQQLRPALTSAQCDLWHLRQKEKVYMQAQQAENVLSSERASWSQERASLSLQLHDAHSQLESLRNDLRRTEIKLEREREKYPTPGTTQENKISSDKEKMQRLYGKYLRAESFRKALIYQKKYLLTVIGEFKETEQMTLAMLAQIHRSIDGDDTSHRHRHPTPSGITKFRSAARVVIAISRMKFLGRRWKRATRVGTPAMAGNLTAHPGSTYVPSTEAFSPTARPSSRQQNRTAYTPPTREPRRYEHHAEARPLYNADPPPPSSRRQILSALDPVHEPTRPPPPSVSSRGVTPSDPGSQEDDFNSYIQRLENLQQRLGQASRNHHSLGGYLATR